MQINKKHLNYLDFGEGLAAGFHKNLIFELCWCWYDTDVKVYEVNPPVGGQSKRVGLCLGLVAECVALNSDDSDFQDFVFYSNCEYIVARSVTLGPVKEFQVALTIFT